MIPSKIPFEILQGTATTPPWLPEEKDFQKEGGFYYACGPSVSTYKKASVLINLPTSYRLRAAGNNWGRNAYISLGVGAKEGAIDIGLRNPSRFGAAEKNPGLEAPTDQGHGWEAICYECNGQKLHEATPGSANKAPAGTVKARVDVRPNPNGRQITLYVEWLNRSNVVLSTYLQTFTLDRFYTWTEFYRFASLVTNDPAASINDKAYMVGGSFETAYLGESRNINWGIKSNLTTAAWIVAPSKCTVPYKWDVGEEFKIDYR